jgi:hypothetical protein
LRDQLVHELQEVGSSDGAANWAYTKNRLTEADAKQVEDAFRARLATLEGVSEQLSVSLSVPKAIDKNQLSHPKPRRARDREHIRFVAKQACLICGRRPADAHHLRFAQHRALGRKVSDEFTVPLCRGHHREAHRSRDEGAWWKKVGVDPTTTARALWLETHPLPPLAVTRDIDTPSQASVGLSDRNSEDNQQVSKGRLNRETNPIIPVDLQ